MNNQYEVLSPWPEVDPIALRGIAPRVADLAGKKVGLYCNSKRAARPIQAVVEKKLKERYPEIIFSHFFRSPVAQAAIFEIDDKDRFVEWVKSVDTVILAVGD